MKADMETGDTLETPNWRRPPHPDCPPINKDGESVESVMGVEIMSFSAAC